MGPTQGGGTNLDSGGSLLTDSSSNDGGLSEASACAGESYPATLVPLDIYVLLDATASMSGGGGSPDIWPDVTSALDSIISDTSSAGIGMGLTYLPVTPASGFVVPGTCTTDTDCPGSTGPCKTVVPLQPKVCANACTSGTVSQDCGLYGDCTAILGDHVCNGSLSPSVSCDPADYGKPAVPMGTLPGNASMLTAAINGKSADGDATPTQPALQGALTYALQWATSHPTHLVNVLFATDGMPNDCTNDSTVQPAADTAKQYFQGTPSIPTFVLGMGQLSDLNLIASSGGTQQAYIASSTSVGSTLVTVFNQIRANGACQYQIPAPSGGRPSITRRSTSTTRPPARRSRWRLRTSAT